MQIRKRKRKRKTFTKKGNGRREELLGKGIKMEYEKNEKGK